MDIDSEDRRRFSGSRGFLRTRRSRCELQALAYHLKGTGQNRITALVIGEAAAEDLAPRSSRARAWTGVEINPIIARRGDAGRFHEFYGDITRNPRVRTRGGRWPQLVRRTPERLDIIKASIVRYTGRRRGRRYTMTENSLPQPSTRSTTTSIT